MRGGGSMRQMSNLALGSSFNLRGAFAKGGREPLSASPLSANVAAAEGAKPVVFLPMKFGDGTFDQSNLAFVLVAEVTLLFFFFSTLVTGPRRSLSLKLSDTRVYEPQIRAEVSLCRLRF